MYALFPQKTLCTMYVRHQKFRKKSNLQTNGRQKKFEDYLHQCMETLANKPDLYNRIMKEVTLVK